MSTTQGQATTAADTPDPGRAAAARIAEPHIAEPHITEPRITEVRIPMSDGIGLAATLLRPEGVGPHPVALLLVGSGEVDRDSDHKSLALGVTRQIADALAQAGIASLRYDKRGVGASGGEYLTTTFRDARDDAAAAVAWLADHDDLDPERIIVIGHSEGAVHAVSLAAVTPWLAGVGLLACPATAGAATLRWQADRIVATMPAVVRGLLRLLRQSPARSQEKLFARIRGSDQAVIRVQGQRLNAGWLRGFIDHDPATELAEVAIPVLALTGARDLQVNPDDLDLIEARVGSDDVEVYRPTGVNHILRRTDGNGSPTGYRKQLRRGEPVDASVLEPLVRWARRVVAPAG